MHNKNNSANTAKENNNKTIIYGGIGILVLFLLFGGLYMWWGNGEKKKEYNNELLSKAAKLIKNSFVSERSRLHIDRYEKSKRKEKDRKELRSFITKKEPDPTKQAELVNEAYAAVKAEMLKLENEIRSMLTQAMVEVMTVMFGGLYKKLTAENKKQNRLDIKNLSEALEELKKCKNAKNNKEVKDHIETALRKVSDIKRDDVQDALKTVRPLPIGLENGKVTPYSKESLEKALKKWDTEYSQPRDDYAIVKALEKQSEAKTEENNAKA